MVYFSVYVVLSTLVLACTAAKIPIPGSGAPNRNISLSDIDFWFNGCWKDSYGRGVGTIPDQCPGEEKDGLLCYPWCQDGYNGVGPVCWQNCPSGFRDDGAFCFKPDAYGRGAGYTSQGSCESKHGPCEKWGLLWYPKCREGFYAFGCCICSPQCPAGMTDIGISCAKHSYGRGAGTPMKCAADKQYDAGLCYPYCNKGYYGIGPVCWSECPKRIWKNECGALCLNDETECTDKVLSLIMDAVKLVLQLVTTIVNPSGEEFSELLKEALNTATGYAYPLCSERTVGPK